MAWPATILNGNFSVSELQPKSRIAQALYDFDSRVNSGLYSAYDWLCRTYSAYAAMLARFRIRGPKRILVDMTSDGATFGMIFALGLIYYALPPIFESDDIWDRGRQYSVTSTTAPSCMSLASGTPSQGPR